MNAAVVPMEPEGLDLDVLLIEDSMPDAELAICNWLVRRARGRIRAENRPGGGVALIAEFPRAAG